MPRIILDVDPGIDDALAMLFALRRPGIEVLALTTVFGNADTETTTRNALRLLDLFGRPDIPVARGAARSLARPFTRKASHIHGRNGLGEVALPAPSRAPVAEAACDLIIRLAREHPGEITLVPVGPLTNVALALLKEPETAQRLAGVVMMGGTLFHPGIPGLPSPMAEANVWGDPEAARVLFGSGARITMVGLDVTMKTLLTDAMMDALSARGDDGVRAAMDMARFYLAAYRAQYPGIAGCALHDPLAVAVAEDPSLVTTEAMRCDVECSGEITRGEVVADRRRGVVLPPNLDVCLEVDVPRVMARFLEALGGPGAPGG
jgi:purine nucleosidase